ncbi:MAG TPA: DNA-binding domain-containing protein, partial [Roseiarcus sp.]
NVAVGLIGALEARYPASRRIAGDDAFRGLARAFARARKPRSPVMIASGEDFPEFLAAGGGVEPCRADVARLENAWVEAYHAEDRAAAIVADLAKLSADCLPGAQIAFHPAARILRFSTPAASIWASAQGGDGPAAPVEGPAEDALVARPDADVRVRVLPPLGYDFAVRLREGAALIEAAAALNDPAFDFGTHLVGLVESGAVATVIPGVPS